MLKNARFPEVSDEGMSKCQIWMRILYRGKTQLWIYCFNQSLDFEISHICFPDTPMFSHSLI